MLDDIDHLLDDAIALHEAKRFFSASAKYLKILEHDALHADTNHNFGLLKVELGLTEEALIFLQTAINTNPNVLQYWVTFINTLINVERFDDVICRTQCNDLRYGLYRWVGGNYDHRIRSVDVFRHADYIYSRCLWHYDVSDH